MSVQYDLKPADLPVDSTSRLKSLDALRGFDMFWIVGGDALASGILSRFPSPTTERLKAQLEHVEWEGFRFYDLIFPLFMFMDAYYGFGDNEGLLSTIPAIATVLLGALAGQWLKGTRTA